jgi:hypothetical protein
VAYLRHARTVTLKRYHDYATVDGAVFSPCQAEQSHDESRIASPHLLPGNSYKHLDDTRVGKGHVTTSAVTQQLKCFPLVRSRVYRRDWSQFWRSYQWVLNGRQPWKVRNWRRADLENWRLYVWHLKSETVVVCVLRSVARRWLVERENPSACATVNWKVCISAVVLYCLYVRVIKCACVTNC